MRGWRTSGKSVCCIFGGGRGRLDGRFERVKGVFEWLSLSIALPSVMNEDQCVVW